jgi:hypothetical protein
MARNIISMAPATVREGHARRLEKERRLVAAPRFVPAHAPLRLVKQEQATPKLTQQQRQLNEGARAAERVKLDAYREVVAASLAFIADVRACANVILDALDGHSICEREEAIVYLDDDGLLRRHPSMASKIDPENDEFVSPSRWFRSLTMGDRRRFTATMRKHLSLRGVSEAAKARQLFWRHWRDCRRMDRMMQERRAVRDAAEGADRG